MSVLPPRRRIAAEPTSALAHVGIKEAIVPLTSIGDALETIGVAGPECGDPNGAPLNYYFYTDKTVNEAFPDSALHSLHIEVRGARNMGRLLLADAVFKAKAFPEIPSVTRKPVRQLVMHTWALLDTPHGLIKDGVTGFLQKTLNQDDLETVRGVPLTGEQRGRLYDALDTQIPYLIYSEPDMNNVHRLVRSRRLWTPPNAS